jgi:peptide/nickel transport system substrate-binding protein
MLSHWRNPFSTGSSRWFFPLKALYTSATSKVVRTRAVPVALPSRKKETRMSVEKVVIVRRSGRRLLLASVMLALGSGLLSAAAFEATAAPDQGAIRSGGTLLIAVPDFDFIDPALARPPDAPFSMASWPVEDATCALLMRYAVRLSPIHYHLVPEVAAGYPSVSRDGRTYTFTIRKGYRFSNGAAVTAQSYASAISRLLSPAMQSPAAPYLEEIVGADAVQQGKALSASGVKVAGNRLSIKLTKRLPDFPARMTMPYLCPVSANLPIDPEGVGAPLPGSGPFYIAEFVRGSHVTLRQNRFYRGPRVRHLDRIVVQIGDDPETISRKVEADQADLDLGVLFSRRAELVATYGVNKSRFWSFAAPVVFYVVMNTERPLFRNNVKLRQAVNFAIDRRALLAPFGAAGAVGAVTDDYLPRVTPGYIDARLYPLKRPDLRKARALARGHTRSGKAVMYTCANILLACRLHGQIVQSNLKQIGIDVEVKEFPTTVLRAKFGTRGEPFDLLIHRHDVAWVDPSQFVRPLLDGRTIRATDNTNTAYFNSPRYNRAMDQADRLSGSARYDAYGRLAVDIATNAAPLAAFATRNEKFFVSTRVGCIVPAAHETPELAGLCLK